MYRKFGKRTFDLAAASAGLVVLAVPMGVVAAIVRLSADGHIASSGIGVTGVAETPFAATDAEAALTGNLPSDALFRHAGLAAGAQSRPVGDVRGPVEYKRAMAAEMTLRALRRATERALAYA